MTPWFSNLRPFLEHAAGSIAELKRESLGRNRWLEFVGGNCAEKKLQKYA